MTVRLLTEHHLEFLNLKGAAQARLCLHLSKCHIVGNNMSRLTCTSIMYCRGTRKRRERLLEETEEEVGVVNPSLVRHTL